MLQLTSQNGIENEPYLLIILKKIQSPNDVTFAFAHSEMTTKMARYSNQVIFVCGIGHEPIT